MVELRGDRYHFVGRRGGVINVGGLKAHPEEIEAVINGHPVVRMSRVSGRKSPITGAIVAAEVVLAEPGADEAAARADILAACRERLAPFKVPAMLRFSASLPLTAGGKLERADCLACSSPAPAAASASPSQRGSPPPATRSSPSPARRAQRSTPPSRRRTAGSVSSASTSPTSTPSPSWSVR